MRKRLGTSCPAWFLGRALAFHPAEIEYWLFTFGAEQLLIETYLRGSTGCSAVKTTGCVVSGYYQASTQRNAEQLLTAKSANIPTPAHPGTKFQTRLLEP